MRIFLRAHAADNWLDMRFMRDLYFNKFSEYVFFLATGALFLSTKYIPAADEGVATYRLDRDDLCTKRAFFIRRILLVCSLAISILVGADGLRSGRAVWAALF